MPPFTFTELMRCAERELRFRRRVYPRWVKDGRYTADQAMRETALMEGIRDHFRALADEAEPQLDLGEAPPDDGLRGG
jgi:hypothetical protein